MSVTVRSRSEVVGTGTSPTLSEPAGASSGDMLVALALSDTAGAITQPSGWTSKYSGTQGGVTWVVSIVARGSSAPNLTWTVTGTVYREIYIVCLQGSSTVSLDSVSASGGTGNSGTHNPNPPSTTAVATSSLAVAGGINFGGSNTGGWTPSTNYTMQTNNADGDDGIVETRSLISAGVEDPSAVGNVIVGGSKDWWDGFTMTFTDLAFPNVIAWVSQ